MNKLLKSQLLAVSSVVGVTVLTGVGLVLSSTASAEAITDIINLTVPSSCNIVATGSTVHEVTVTSGLIKNAESTSDPISKSRITATCNDANGYSIYAIGYSNDIEGTTAMIAGDPLTSESNISTGNATTGNISNWGMKVIASTGTDAPTINTTDAGGSFAAYRAVPTAYTKVASKASGVVTTNTSYIDTAYQVYISTNQPAGSYSGKVKYVLINPGMSSEELPEGYEVNSQGQLVKAVFGGITTMQDMTTAICAASEENETKQLKDIRDGKYYWVTKLKDGNCWMTQNLDLGYNNMDDMTLTPADSDVVTNFTLTKPGDLSFESANTDVVNYRDPGEQYYVSSGTTSNDTSYTSKSACESANSAELCAHSHAGNYYNWYTATAGTGTQAITSGEATSSICPKGWRLPTNSSDPGAKSYSNLLRSYNITSGGTSYNTNDFNNIRSNPLYFVRSGDYGTTSLYSAASGGHYLSSTVSSTYGAYTLYFASGYISPQNGSGKCYGYSVRCLSRNNPIDVTVEYDKNTTDAVSNMPNSQALTNFDGETTLLTISSEVPTRDGYVFVGWATTSDGEAKYSAGSTNYLSSSDMPIDGILKLYAKWQEGSAEINFIVGGKSYTAAPGSTWADWISDPNYDSSEFCVSSDNVRIMQYDSYLGFCVSSMSPWRSYVIGVSPTDVIISGMNYSWGVNSCFLPGTKITLWDGKTKKIEDLTYNDKLLIWNFDEGHYDTANIAWLTQSGLHNDHYYELTFSDGTVLKTTGEKSNHKVFNADEQYFQGVSSIEVGTHVYTENGIVTLVDKEYIEDDVEYYNVITNTHFNVFANGVLTGNRYDNMYKISNMKYIKENRMIKPYFEFANRGIDRYWYDTLRLGEQSDSMDEIVDYIHKLESQMRERE